MQERILAIKRTRVCVDCGESNIDLLEFDHRDPSQKRGDIGKVAWKWGWPRIAAEIAKCDVRCVHCHRRRTNEQMAANGCWGTVRGVVAVPVSSDQLDIFTGAVA